MKTAITYTVVVMQFLAGMIWIPFWIIVSGVVCIHWHGFGVDMSGNVYVGKEEEIAIYNEGQCIGTVAIPRFRSYRMTVECDTIVIATSMSVYRYDTAGNELSCIEDAGWQTHSRIGRNMNMTCAVDGTEYTAHTFMRHRILCDDGTVVYRMPVLDYSVKLFYIASCVSFAGLGVIEIVKRKIMNCLW